MKKVILLLLWFLVLMPGLALAQSTAVYTPPSEQTGIHFEKNLDWEAVKKKARAENKYIFLDCFATWCGPCKAMDKEVYPDETVGQLMNEKFIAVKVQMDTTRYDDEAIKKWYTVASSIQSNYTVTAFPTFLFFFPDGKPLHKAVGYKTPEQFIALAKDALDPAKQYYSILANFESGKMDTAEMKGSARSLSGTGTLAEKIAADYLVRIPPAALGQPDNLQLMMEFNGSSQVREIAVNYLSNIPGKDLCAEKNVQLINTFRQAPRVQDIVLHYLNNLNNQALQHKDHLALLSIFKDNATAKAIADRYISSLQEKELYTKDNIEFLVNFTKSAKDKGFATFYHHGKQVDSVMGVKDYAQTTADNIIVTEAVSPYWKAALRGEDVPWEKISKEIIKKYNQQYADRIVLRTKVIVYKSNTETHNKNWPEYIQYNIRYIEQYGTDTTSAFWDTMLLNNFAFDAIFYHSTDIKQLSTAIKWMEGVMRRNPKDGNTVDTYANLLYKAGKRAEAIRWEEKALQLSEGNPSIKENLAKMKKGVPTWLKE